MEHLIIFLLAFNTGVVCFTAWHVVSYVRWKRMLAPWWQGQMEDKRNSK